MHRPDPHSGREGYLSCRKCCEQRLQLPCPHVVFLSRVVHVQWCSYIKAWPLSSTSDKSEGPLSLTSSSSEAVVGLPHSPTVPCLHSYTRWTQECPLVNTPHAKLRANFLRTPNLWYIFTCRERRNSTCSKESLWGIAVYYIKKLLSTMTGTW